MIGDLAVDARVWREVRTLAEIGLDLKLIGCRYEISGVQRRLAGDVTVVEVPLGSRNASVSSLKRAGALARVWLEVLVTPARIYHMHNIHTGPAGWLAARARRGKLVYDAHELYGEVVGAAGPLARTVARLSAAVERWMVRHADVVITTNPSRVRELERRHGRAGIAVLANVPDRVDQLEPLDAGFPQNVPVLLYQGGIYAQGRPFREVLEAVAMLPKIHFAIVGFGQRVDLELIETWSRELGIKDRVHLLPPRPFGELVHTAAMATVGVVPIKPHTTNHRLGDTNKLHEYLMAGLPVAASDLPEIRRVARDGDPPVGELFDPSSAESIRQAITRVLDDRYQERRREARRLGLEVYNWQSQRHVLIDLYAQLCGGGR